MLIRELCAYDVAAFPPNSLIGSIRVFENFTKLHKLKDRCSLNFKLTHIDEKRGEYLSIVDIKRGVS